MNHSIRIDVMAVQESDREDLMRDATALHIRTELLVPGCEESVVAGRRNEGGWSVYFGQDPCYHFDATGRLRRAFVDGFLYRTQGSTLARLHRQRTAEATFLVRNDLDPETLSQFLTAMHQQLNDLSRALLTGQVTILQSVPAETDVAGLLNPFLADVLDGPQKLAPSIGTRRR